MARSPLTLKARALRYLFARDYSRTELAHNLAPHAHESGELRRLLDIFEATRLLFNFRFCDPLVIRRARRFGNSRNLTEVQSQGSGGTDLAAAKAEMIAGEVARARHDWQRKFGTAGRDAAERAKQMRFMLQRGFSHTAIKKVMQGAALPGHEMVLQDEPPDQ